jgi:hypothetical protein
MSLRLVELRCSRRLGMSAAPLPKRPGVAARPILSPIFTPLSFSSSACFMVAHPRSIARLHCTQKDGMRTAPSVAAPRPCNTLNRQHIEPPLERCLIFDMLGFVDHHDSLLTSNRNCSIFRGRMNGRSF